MVDRAKQFYDFGPFRIDAIERQLLRDSQVVSLTPKVFDTLLVLVENSGHILTKDEVMRSVWAETAVEEANLTKNISTLRKALGEIPGQHQFIETIPWRGYRFVADVRAVGGQDADLVVEERTRTHILIEQEPGSNGESRPVLGEGKVNSQPKRRITQTVLVGCAGIALAAAAIFIFSIGGDKTVQTVAVRRTIAVLPFKMLDPEAGDQYLGLGIADSIIAKTSQINGLTVRPTSAVRKYVQTEVDVLEAAREQKVETVLDGTIQQSGERLRVSVNLLNVIDGSSLWAETFDLSFKDIFEMQDEVSRQVAAQLRLKLSEAEGTRIAKRNTSSPDAYNYYTKALYHFYNIGPNLNTRSESDLAIDLFKKAIEYDPNYALAHAQLGYTYTKIAVFQEENPAWIEQARQELAMAERLNPQLAEVHAARYFIAFSQYEGWHIETAVRELRLAQKIDPTVGHSELGDLSYHIGLEQQGSDEYEIALKIDPNSDMIKSGYISMLFQAARPDDALELNKRLFDREPDIRYYLEKRMVKETEPLIEQEFQKGYSDLARSYQMLLLALQDKHEEAQAAVPAFLEKLRKNRGYHHYTYNVARVYALGGKSKEALKWLRVTVKEGFPCYPLFERDAYLDPIRKDPAFSKFLAEMKVQWEGYVRNPG